MKLAQIPYSHVHDVYQVAELDAIKTKLTRTRMPDGTRINLQPLPVDLPEGARELSFAPRYGQHSRAILEEVGLADAEIDALQESGVVFAQGASPG